MADSPPPELPRKASGFLPELRRRRVPPIAGAYIAIAWLATEMAGFLLEQSGAPGWILRVLAIAFVVGFPVTVIIAWVVQVEPGGKWALDSSKSLGKTVAAAAGKAQFRQATEHVWLVESLPVEFVDMPSRLPEWVHPC